jgi:HTH-type transcriptional regulator / antitoxin HigA
MSDNARPAEVFPPGEFLKKELASRGWSQVELSEILGRPPRVVSEIMTAKRAITPETAKGLAAAFGTSAELWMNLESRYQLFRTVFEEKTVTRRARLYAKFPVKEMMRRGWVATSKDLDKLERSFCAFFSISSIDEPPAFPHSAKKRSYIEPPEVGQLAWLIRAEQIAKGLKVKSFSDSMLRNAIEHLRSCLRTVEDVSRVPNILAAAGVRFVIMKFLPGAKLDGACFWMDNGRAPVVAMSLRLDRVDNFWHTLFHELDHVLNGEGKQMPIVDVVEMGDMSDTNTSREESRANESAADYCIDREKFEKWIINIAPMFSRREIVSFAEEMHVHPAIVLGQLQHRGLVKYSFHRDLLEPVRHVLIETIATDGFENSGGT